MSAEDLYVVWDEYEAWAAEHCEHGVPPNQYCEDCDG